MPTINRPVKNLMSAWHSSFESISAPPSAIQSFDHNSIIQHLVTKLPVQAMSIPCDQNSTKSGIFWSRLNIRHQCRAESMMPVSRIDHQFHSRLFNSSLRPYLRLPALSAPYFTYNRYCMKLPFFTKPKSVYNSTPMSDAVICTVPQPYALASSTTFVSSSLAIPGRR